MASTPRGRRLTEDHRLAQAALKAQFVIEFTELWPMLDPRNLDETAPAWIRRAEDAIAEYREESARLTEEYFVAFRAAEAPQAALESPPPVVTRSQPAKRRSSRHRGDKSQKPIRVGTGKLIKPTIDFTEFDKAARSALISNGPANVKSKTKRGKSPEQAAREAAIEAGGSAARHVLSGGRAQHLEMVRQDASAIGWIRVTDGDPCAFCAMLASRGPKYQSEWSATRVVKGRGTKRPRAIGDLYHDNCGCTAEAVYSNTQAWPGRGREFQKLWYEATKGYSGQDARNAFRRAYERGIRERERRTAESA